MQSVAQRLAEQIEAPFGERGLQQGGALQVVDRVVARDHLRQHGAHLRRFHFDFGDAEHNPDLFGPATFDGDERAAFGAGVINVFLDDGHDHSAEHARREVVAVALEMQSVIEELFLAQTLTRQGFKNRNAGDDGGAAAAQAPRERNLAVDAQAGAGDFPPPLLGGVQRGAGDQVRFVARQFIGAFAAQHDLETPFARLDFDPQVERKGQPAGVEARAEVRGRRGNDDFGLGHLSIADYGSVPRAVASVTQYESHARYRSRY